jgi:hypothetical protein
LRSHNVQPVARYAPGRNSKAVREWLEKQYAETAGEETVKLCLKARLCTRRPRAA